MKVGDLVKHIKPYSEVKMGIILRKAHSRHQYCLNDSWVVHWCDGNPYDEQCYDYDLQVIG